MKVKLTEIIPNPNNPRLIKDEKFKQLVKSIKDFPQMLELRPIVVNDQMVVLGGNMRLKACKEAGLKEVPVIKASELTEEQQREFIIKDNVGFGEWDWSMIANEWDAEQVIEWGLDIPDFKVEPEAQEDDYEIPDEIQTDIVLGDLFEIGEHRLLCGDSTSVDDIDKLMAGKKADMVFTDPPYGVNYDGGHANEKRRDKLKNDHSTLIYDGSIPMMHMCSKEEAPLYIWFADRYATEVVSALKDNNYDVRSWIIWNKNMAQFGAIGAQYKSKHEPCIYAYKKGKKANWCGANNEVTVWDVKRESKNEHHPTQKPIELPARALKNHSVGLVADLFGGSGSTMVASHQLDRKAYLMELDPKYCQVIIDRMRKLDPNIKIKKNGVDYDG